jgi:hypothetical protein
MVVFIAALMVAFFVSVVFSVDVAYVHLVNSELRASTDAAARAAVDTLGLTDSLEQATQAAIDVAAANRVAGQPLILEPGDIVFGRTHYQPDGSLLFAASEIPYGAARVTGRKLDDSPSGAVPLFFAAIVGSPEYETSVIATASRLDRDICLVVDRSGSMESLNRMVDLRAAVTGFLAILLEETGPDEMVGLASYNQAAQIEHELTDDYTLIQESVDALIPDGQTNIGGGIDTGRDVLQGGRSAQRVEKTIIVMTDGYHNTGTDPLEAAQRAADENIRIHAITFGRRTDKIRMQAVADIGGGNYYHAPDGSALREIYEEIAFTMRTVLVE